MQIYDGPSANFPMLLQIYDGPTADSPMLLFTCGYPSIAGEVVTTTGNSAFIQFESGQEHVGHGFIIEWSGIYNIFYFLTQ